MAGKNNIPQQGESPLKYFYRQFTRKPAPVKNVSLQGRTAIVTGSNTGVGFQASRQVLELGLSKLILAVRNEEKGKKAAARLISDLKLNDDVVEVWHLDLSVYDSVFAFAERTKSLPTLDIVILNAGMWSPTRAFNEHTGHEETIQVNYLSTALLAILLLPVAKAKRASQLHPTRITFTSSEVAGFTKFAEKNEVPLFPALDRKDVKVDAMDRMFISKLLQQFFITELAKLVPTSVALINSCSPGSVYDTEFNREFETSAISKRILKFMGNSSPVGARMITDAAVNHGEETHGQFLSFQEVVGYVSPDQRTPFVLSDCMRLVAKRRHRKAPIIYTAEGKKISQQLWKETLAELAFANVKSIINDVSAAK